MALKLRKRFGDVVVDAGLADRAEIEAAVRRAKEAGVRLGEVLIASGVLRQEQLADLLASYSGVPRVKLDEVQIAPELLELIPDELIRQHQLLAVRLRGRVLSVALTDPFDFAAIDAVRAATRFDVEALIATSDEIQRAYDRHFGLRQSAKLVLEELEEETRDEDEELPDEVDESPRIRAVNMLIAQAIRERASDIHIEPQETRLRVRYRIDGVLRDVMEFPKKLKNEITARIKVMADLDITERRRPQDGRLRVGYEGRAIDLRASTLPTTYGEKVVLRILSRADDAVDLEGLQFRPQNVALLEEMLAKHEGIILVTGPTGSGKTTTLHSFIRRLNTPDVNITTIEDPVELRTPGITQVNVNGRVGLGFAATLRSVLRQDPDVIMVGEMRDHETAEIAVRAALTGHLVLSTLHTNSAAATIGRLLDMGIEPYLLADTLVGVVSQRLVRRVCSACAEPVRTLTASESAFMGGALPAGSRLLRGRGCPACGDSGYRGRVAVEEVLLMDRTLRAEVRAGASEEALEQLAIRNGMISMKESALARVRDGITTVDEVQRNVYAREV